jgi:hypothetical protein
MYRAKYNKSNGCVCICLCICVTHQKIHKVPENIGSNFRMVTRCTVPNIINRMGACVCVYVCASASLIRKYIKYLKTLAVILG